MKSDELKWSRDLAMKYLDDLNGFDLYSESERFKNQAYNLMDNFKSATPFELLKFIHKYSLKDVCPNIEIALRIFLTIPVTTATCERSFSKLKIIKNYLRSTMSQDRLTNMGIISIERELASKINFEDIIDEFGYKKSTKSEILKCKIIIFFKLLYKVIIHLAVFTIFFFLYHNYY